ncbi:MAG: phasin family protein [Pseudomonadota bacterium]
MTATASPFTFPFSAFNSDAFSSFFPDTDSMGSLTRGAMEASTASTRASVKGMQEASQTMMAHMKQQMNLSVETGKKLAEAASLEDALSIQTKFLKSAFENNLKGFNELSEVYTETMRDAFAPLAKQAKKASKSAKTA